MKKHTLWIHTISNDTFQITIRFCREVTKETVLNGIDSVKEYVKSFKNLYDGDFDILSDVNYT